MRTLLAAALACLPLAAWSAVPGQDPDWPCQQRLVPQVSAGNFWSGELPADAGAAASDPRVQKLVADTVSRDISDDEVAKGVAQFLKSLKGPERARIVPAAFLAVVDGINGERADIIQSLKDLNQRQRSIAAMVSDVNKDLAAIPENAEGADGAKRDEINQRKTFLTRDFTETRQTMRYACEVPGALDQRLGAVARQLQAGLAGKN